MRPPFSQRQSKEAQEEFYVLREGVPSGLARSLVLVVLDHFFGVDDFDGRRHLDTAEALRFDRATDFALPGDWHDCRSVLVDDSERLLDAVDFILGRYEPGSAHSPGGTSAATVGVIQVFLDESRSIFTVGQDGAGFCELQRRQADELTQVMQTAMTAGGHAAEHLRRAWSKAFGREQDLNGCCDAAVRAIEVVAKPIVSPKNENTTLGTLIADMRNKPSKWETDSEAPRDVDTVIAMMEMVWKGHYRHGDESVSIDVNAEGAMMVVHLATMLVEWFRAGNVRRIA